MTLTTSDVRPATAATAAPTRNVRLLRAICIAGKRVEPGTDLTLAAWLAMQLVGSGQAVLVAEAAPPADEQPAGEPKPPAPAVKAARGKEHAK